MSLTLQPITYPEACAFVAAHHRHHLPPQGWKFGIAVNDGQKVVGVDIVPQPRYPFAFVQADALEYVAAYGHEFDVIHASPPCQGYSPMRHLPWLRGREYPLLIDATRAALQATGKLWVIENVAHAQLNGALLCGGWRDNTTLPQNGYRP